MQNFSRNELIGVEMCEVKKQARGRHETVRDCNHLPHEHKDTILSQWGKWWKQLNEEFMYLLTGRVMWPYALHTVWISECYGHCHWDIRVNTILTLMSPHCVLHKAYWNKLFMKTKWHGYYEVRHPSCTFCFLLNTSTTQGCVVSTWRNNWSEVCRPVALQSQE
jgi:hypothetical protein